MKYGRSAMSAQGRDGTAALIDSYVAALATGDAETGLTTLSPDVVLQSPFNTWQSRQVPSVFRARSRAFADVRIDTVVRGAEQAVILWSAAVEQAHVQGVELVSIRDGTICRIDVFLRPALALEVVHRAMAAAWRR